MGRKEDRRAMKKPLVKKKWFWFLILLLLVGGGVAAVKLIPIPINLPFGQSDTTESTEQSTTQSSVKTITASEAITLIETYKSIALSDPLVEETKGASFDEVVALLGEPSSTVDSELSGANSKIAIWNNFNGSATISITFKEEQASAKSMSKIPVEELKAKITVAQIEAIPLDGSYTYDQAVKYLGTPDSLSDALIDGTNTVTAIWTTNMEQGVTFHFDNSVAVSKETIAG